MDDEDKRADSLLMHIAAAEGIIKAELCSYADEHLTTAREKVGLVAAVSLGMAAAALHAAMEGLTDHGDLATADMSLGVFMEVVAPELRALNEALNREVDRRGK